MTPADGGATEVVVERFTKTGWVFDANVRLADARAFLRMNPWGWRIRTKAGQTIGW